MFNHCSGCDGTVAWKIGDTGKMLVVMYSCPYSFDFYTNWCGVGIFDVSRDEDFYQLMYYGAEDSFKRKDYYYDADEVRYSDDDRYEVSATMGNTHKAEIQVRLYFIMKL